MKAGIGCLIQWYEADIIEGYFKSLRYAIDRIKQVAGSEVQIKTYNSINCSTVIEQAVDISKIYECVSKIKTLHYKYGFGDCTVMYQTPSSVGTFRNDINSQFTKDGLDIIIWGESDMLVPVEMLECVYTLWKSPIKDKKWIATFASCKMWDDSWKHLEHPEFTSLPHSDSDKDWWSVNYVMSYEEMCKINSKVDQYDIKVFNQNLKFNGCGLVLTTEIIKSGVNVPTAAFFVHEDTAFLELLKRVFPDLPQYHFSNILLVHNRKDPNKRPSTYIKGEEGQTIGQRRRSNPVYTQANQLSQHNVNNLFNTQIKFYDWESIQYS